MVNTKRNVSVMIVLGHGKDMLLSGADYSLERAVI